MSAIKRFSLLAIILLSLTSYPLYGQFREGFLGYAPFGQPLIAESFPDHFRIETAFLSMDPSYDYSGNNNSSGYHAITVFGTNFPLWSGSFLEEKYLFSVAQGMSAVLWMDIFEPSTSVVNNIDFRVSLPSFTLVRKFDMGFMDNLAFFISPFRHESSHVGDELVIARRNRGYAIPRVNVSYDYAEFKFSLNEPMDFMSENHNVRLGYVWNLELDTHINLTEQRNGSWYFIDEREGDIYQAPSAAERITKNPLGYRYVPGPRNRRQEYYLQYQYQSKARYGFQAVFSSELRSRVVYGFDLNAKVGDAPSSATGDGRTLAITAFAGVRYNRSRNSQMNHMSLGVRYYRGNCPYGQFRSVADFSQLGFSLIYE